MKRWKKLTLHDLLYEKPKSKEIFRIIMNKKKCLKIQKDMNKLLNIKENKKEKLLLNNLVKKSFGEVKLEVN